ncbi:MAG TPA: FG-GAP-like repeat-containing protein, partial [Ignavibacteria bacterium]|nr:FG-GAP-like repeat-containing protein [Ignavibacteria bacterium]
MKTFYRIFVVIFIIIIVSLQATNSASSNWIIQQDKNNENIHTPNTQYTPYTQTDSLPSGVTKDWLNSLTDESGNSLIPDDDPEVDAFQSKIFNGLGTGYRHGISASSAGDVNGDGYDDVIIGAYGYSTNTGRAYIYFGGQNMNTTADVIITGGATSNYFGYSVSTAGDVNGDGFSDVIVGAYGYSSNTGRAYIYLGGNSMDNTADLIINGSAGISFGNSVSSAGDVNGDGFSDVIVGAQAHTSNTGRAYIFYGGSPMNSSVDVTMTGEATNNFFGSSVSDAGDVNGDGFGDVIVGAYGYSTSTGRAYIYHGGSSMNNVADLILTGDATNNNFGSSVSEAGDVNGDGYSDIIIGAYGYLSNIGAAYIFRGAPAMSTTPYHIVTGEAINNLFGFSVSSAGDVNGDGFSDVIVGAIAYSSQTGRAYVYFGGITMKTIPDAVMTGSSTSENFGRSVASAGDVNGDGYQDIIVGGEGYNSSTGRAYLFDYYMKNEITSDLAMTGEGLNNYFGSSVSNAGDVNGDGYPDVIVGAYGYNANTGRAYIFLGGPLMDNIPDVTMTGAGIHYYFGRSVATAGDVNGDGYADVIVGAYGYSSFGGRAYIYYGGAVMNNGADVILTEAAFDGLGYSVSTAGDVNGDGYSDVIVGTIRPSSLTGGAYIYFGGASMNNVVDLSFTGSTAGDDLGNTVSTAGDVNGDGFDDVMIAVPNSDAGGVEVGKVNLYFGGLAMNNSADIVMTGENEYDHFGSSVSSAGDVNGDGFSDVIIGTPDYSVNGMDGKVYIYYGGSNMNIVFDVVLEGTGEFGHSASSAGDVNADGYDDVIIGAWFDDGNGNNSGRSFIYLGGVQMDNSSDVVMRGDTAGNYLGISVSAAGDLNGDGYDDVICGAYGFRNAGLNYTGRTYAYFGSAISAKPILNYVKDVPNDQGGKVNLKWARSGYDVNGINRITSYTVLRSFPPSGGNFAWNTVAEITAETLPFYSFIDNTPYDSTSNNSGNLYYRIKAKSSNAQEFWYSGILFGRSIDNIAPLMVSPFTASGAGANVSLNW